MNPAEWAAEMMAWDGAEAAFEIQRTRLDEGASFSVAAMDELNAQVFAFIGTRVMRRWDGTGEPPSVLRVDITVTTS